MGGAETVLATLTSGLAARGHGVRFCALLGLEPEPLPAAFAGLPAAGVEIVEVRVSHRSYPTEARRVGALLAKTRPDVLHTHGYHGDLIGWWAARTRTPAVSTIHGYTGGGATNRLYEWLDRWVLRRFAAVVAVSQPLVDRLTADGIAPERVEMILLEAMGAGVPVVATRVGGIPDVVSDRTAVLVAPDRPDLLAGAIRGCLEAGPARTARVAAARERIATAFGLDRWLDRHEALYRRIA